VRQELSTTMRLTRPGVVRELASSRTPKLVHGERKSFIGGYRWQRSAPAVGTPVTNGGGGLFYVLSSGLREASGSAWSLSRVR
jgi:hypothetical protein